MPDAYEHIQNDRSTIGVLVELGGVDLGAAGAHADARAIAHEIALHVSFAAPGYLTREKKCPTQILAREARGRREKSRNEGVPAAKFAGAVQGHLKRVLQKFIVVLLDQPSVKDPKVRIGETCVGEPRPQARTSDGSRDYQEWARTSFPKSSRPLVQNRHGGSRMGPAQFPPGGAQAVR